MQRKELPDRRVWLICLIIALVIIIVRIVPVIGARDDIIYGMEAVTPHWDKRSLFYPQETTLKRGYYTVTLEYDTPYDMTCSTETGHHTMLHYIYADEPVEMPSGQQAVAFNLWSRTEIPIRLVLSEAHESAQFQEASFLLRYTYRPLKSAAYELFLAAETIVLLLAVYLFVRRFRKAQDAETRQVLFGLALLILLINLPTLVDYLPYGHDQPMHVTRIEHLAEGLKNGVFPVRMHPGWYHGYGNPIGIGYADTFLYPFALLHLIAVPLWKCFQVYERVMNTALILIAYLSFRYIAKGKKRIALTSTALYGIGVYYIVDLYVRGAVGEAAAMVFLPLVAAGFCALLRDRAKDGMLFLICGYTGLLQSHNITTMATAYFCVFFCLIYWKEMLQRSRLIPLIKAAGMTVLINLGFLVPMLDYYSRYEFRTKAWYSVQMQGSGSSIAQFLMTAYEPVNNMSDQGVAGQLPLTVGWASLAVFFAALYFLCRKQTGRRKKGVACLTALSAFALFMSTAAFPYHWLDLHLHFLYQMTGETFHMPWRYLTIAAALLASLNALLLSEIAEEGQIKTYVLISASCFLLFLAAAQGLGLMSQWMNETYPCMQLEKGGTIGENLFIPKGIDLDAMDYDTAVRGELVEIGQVDRRGTTITAGVRNTTGTEQAVDFPLWSFYGYRAYDAQGTSFTIDEETFERVRVFVPAGYAGILTVSFREPVYWRIAEIAALLGLLWLLAQFCKIIYKGFAHETRYIE